MILILDTADNKEVFLGLWQDGWKAKISWEAGRNLSADILTKLEKLFAKAGKEFKETTGVIVDVGPGSFTGLRIGLSVANTFAYSLDIPIAGVSETDSLSSLVEAGLKILENKKGFTGSVIPVYGREPNITKPRQK